MLIHRRNARIPLLLILWLGLVAASTTAAERFRIEIKSSADKSNQPSYVILPDGYRDSDQPRPLLVSLHSWSGDLEQRNTALEQEANRRGWVYLFPNFRGRNDHPEACGSLLAQRDILDAVEHALKTYRLDPQRVYLSGVSGGGHMTMLMAARYPRRWTAASAWVGISDLAAWHALHAKGRYGEMARKSCGGAPGESPEIDKQFKIRSPLTYLHQAKDVPLDLAAGVHDGHKGSVPIRHSLDAFNAIARANQSRVVSEQEIEQLSRPNGRLDAPQQSDRAADDTFGREIHLRRRAGPARVTIFEGGHEGIASAAAAWLAKHSRDTSNWRRQRARTP